MPRKDASPPRPDLRSRIAAAARFRFLLGAAAAELATIRTAAEAAGIDATLLDALDDAAESTQAATDAVIAHVEQLEAEAAEQSGRPAGASADAVDSVLAQRYPRPSERRTT